MNKKGIWYKEQMKEKETKGQDRIKQRSALASWRPYIFPVPPQRILYILTAIAYQLYKRSVFL
jgi:hypothetical protein